MGRRALVGMGAVMVLALSGCGSSDSGVEGLASAGLAARADTFQVTQAQVRDEVAAVQAALGSPAADTAPGLASSTVQRLVQDELIRGAAADLGVSVTETEIQESLAQIATSNGGMDALNAAAAQQGIPPQSIEQAVETQLLVTAIGATLAPSGDANAQLQAAQQLMAKQSASVGVEVAPRYGTWDPESLATVPGTPAVAQTQAQ